MLKLSFVLAALTFISGCAATAAFPTAEIACRVGYIAQPYVNPNIGNVVRYVCVQIEEIR